MEKGELVIGDRRGGWGGGRLKEVIETCLDLVEGLRGSSLRGEGGGGRREGGGTCCGTSSI